MGRVMKIRYWATFSAILALLVVMLGAYTRLTDAGLGCPDWPGCYGHIIPQKFTIEIQKAWTEMAHRYVAGTLALLILFIAIKLTYLQIKSGKYKLPWCLSIILVLLVFFQAILGMWTVTLKLLPVVVMSHLLGGIMIFSCLCLLSAELRQNSDLNTQAINYRKTSSWNAWIVLGLCIVLFQIGLGGWVSSNYAGLACIGFPKCNGQWLPEMEWSKGLYLFSPVGSNYQGGLLDHSARAAIQYTHRLGAYVTVLYILGLCSLIWIKIPQKSVRILALFIICLVLIQLSLGILNVLYLLPLWVAVAHNGVAALLLASLLLMWSSLKKRSSL
jgi:cytochrome c oxidase assembly protein subunit 15